MIATVTLNPTIDIIAPVDSLIPGIVLRSKKILSHPGGKGTNTARALAALGANVIASGFAGRKDADAAAAFMKKYGVRPEFTVVPGSNRLCLLISGKDNETVINSESNISINANQRRSFLKKLMKISGKAGLMVFSGSLPLSLPPDFYADCIRAVKGRAVSILDTHSKNLLYGIKAGPDMVKANINEFETAFGVSLSKNTVFKKFISGLSRKYGIRVIIATMGKHGSVLYTAGLFTSIKPLKVKKSVSAVGCGDAYSAGLAYGIEKGMTIVDCCRLGAACASANLSHQGACFFNKKEVSDFLPQDFF